MLSKSNCFPVKIHAELRKGKNIDGYVYELRAYYTKLIGYNFKRRNLMLLNLFIFCY